MLFVAISFYELWLLFQLCCFLELTLAGNLKCRRHDIDDSYQLVSVAINLKLTILHPKASHPTFPNKHTPLQC